MRRETRILADRLVVVAFCSRETGEIHRSRKSPRYERTVFKLSS